MDVIMTEKHELGTLTDEFVPKWVKYLIFSNLVLYMFGSILLKYVAGAESFSQGLSVTLYGTKEGFKDKWGGFDPYYVGVVIFASLSLYFSFGNIENIKWLQIIMAIMSISITFLMVGTSIVSLFLENGGIAPPENLFTFDIKYIDKVFAGSVFIFI